MILTMRSHRINHGFESLLLSRIDSIIELFLTQIILYFSNF